MKELKRIVRPWPTRYVIFVKRDAGMIHENGTVVKFFDPADLETILELATIDAWKGEMPRVLYLVGGWNAAATPTTEWLEPPAGWHRTSYQRSPLSADYKNDDGRKIRLMMTAQWFGTCDSASLCQRTYVRLRTLLRGIFDEHVSLMGTPARTGLDLIERSLPTNKKTGQPYHYPVIDGDLKEKIEHNVGQGRMQWIGQPGGDPNVEALYSIDASWMYMACVRHLPVQPIEHDDVDELAEGGYRPGFYRVMFRVPADWHHIGLLPVWIGRPSWPAIPDGQWYESFCCGEELRLAILENGWEVQIQERWLFAGEKAPGSDPLRTWSDKLKALREACTESREKDLAGPLRAAIRAISIKAIGSLHRKERHVLVETPADQLPPEAMGSIDEESTSEDGLIRWWKPVNLDPNMEQFMHPEWAALVWGRARARLARAALKLPYGSILALRNDEIVSTQSVAWPDDGKPGTFRLKGQPLRLAGRPVPANEQQLLKLRREANILE